MSFIDDLKESRSRATGIFSWGRTLKGQTRKEYEKEGKGIFGILSGFIPGNIVVSFLGSFWKKTPEGTSLSVNLGEKEEQQLALLKYGIMGLALYLIVAKWKP
jgi:hypothetical protein